jgi:DNA polymerase I-like protein with 3'-5' exonuclease and polymerase domains
MLSEQIARLKTELEEVKPNCLLVMGDEPAQIITGKEGILKWRGSIVPSTLVPGLKCVLTVHPAWILRGALWKWEPVYRHIDVKRAIEESATPSIVYPTRNAIVDPSLNTVLEYIEEAKRQEWLSFDYETIYDRKNPGDIRLACIGIGWRDDEALCIPLLGAGSQNHWSEIDEGIIMKRVAELFESPVKKIGQNLGFEWIISWFHHIYPANIGIDTMLLHHCLYQDFGGTEDFFDRKHSEGKPGHSLRFLNSQYTRSPFYKDDRKMWARGQSTIHRLWWYNCMDVMVTYEVAMKEMQEAKDRGLWDFYLEFYNRPFPHTIRMEWEGILIDQAERTRVSDDTAKQIETLKLELNQLVGFPINVWSAPQMKNLLYVQLGYEERKHRKRGHLTADRSTLEYFAAKHNDKRIKLIIEIRKLADMKSDVLDSRLGEDGRMHSHYKLGGTDGARWSSTRSILGSGTNLQNVPRRGPARGFFLP